MVWTGQVLGRLWGSRGGKTDLDDGWRLSWGHLVTAKGKYKLILD